METKTNPTKKFHSLPELESLYKDGQDCDKQIFAEMRSNLLLISGEHYQKRHATFFQRLKDNKDLPDQTKLRLTKNHIQKIAKGYVNHIISMAPGVTVDPKDESDLQDQKAAELNESVWMDFKVKHRMPEMIDEFGDDFVGLGEIAVKIFFDPSAGKIKAYKQKIDEVGQNVFTGMDGEETNEPISESGIPNQPAQGEPVYEGDFVAEPILGFNLLRAPEAKEMRHSPHLIIRKMVEVKKLQSQFPEVKDKIKASMDETMIVFDTHNISYGKVKNEVMYKEIYFRPCVQYPNGYFYHWTKETIVTKGELPGGVFPIVTQYFDRVQTSPRGRSPVKIMRPYQIEINRAASKMAEHQITLGDDKILIQNGTKISSGVALPGVRAINFTGMQPGILAGRDGSQYLAYMQAQIAEMYTVMNMAEIEEGSDNSQLDPFALLFKSASQKKKFVRYVSRFENFLKNFCTTYLELAKLQLPDDKLIYAIGKKEQINMPEFRSTKDLCYTITVDAQAEDIESKLGKQMVLNHALQYVGNKLEKEDIGKIMRLMPYGNFEESFDDMTQSYDNATNMILALDRGEPPYLTGYDDYVYLIKRLSSRMGKADFKFIDPNIQQMYRQVIDQLEQLEAQQQQEIQAAKDGYIPTGGYMVTAQVYVSDPSNPLKTRLARIPYESLAWLIQKLEAQGSSLDALETMNQGAVSQIASKMLPHPGVGKPNGMGSSSPQSGAVSPTGVINGRASSGNPG